ncbi:uncharacterized protein [Cardiocondyla obscurior]|uniref:uncharacterized protein n=1 Tax=Cardiocondyla obscurior TaxID=286306 RepID=UPI0039656310
MSFIEEDIVRKAQLKTKAASIPLLGIGGLYSGRTRGVVSIYLQSIYDSSSCCNIQTYILPRLTTKLPPCHANKDSWSHIAHLPLADPDFACPGMINIIIGADHFGSIIKEGLIHGDISEPIAQNTIFGWVLSGPISASLDNHQMRQVYHCNVDLELKELLSRFWLQEEVTNKATSVRTPEEEDCERHFLSTHQRDSKGRYVVRLPLKKDPNVLGDSKKRAICCLNRLTQRFSKDPTLYQLYTDFLNEYKEMGHMILNTETGSSSPSYYLPHHGVIREDSKTTKLRVVFNGSSRTDSSYSLNDILHSGPKLQNEIKEILLWIRTHRILFSTDIVKMFRQINLHPDDWNLQQILWRESSGQLNVYKLTTVTYGLSCAPYLALRSLNQLVIDEGQQYPLAVVPLTKGRYVDDIFGGAEDLTEARTIIDQLIHLCNAGQFPLQKWCSNYSEILPFSERGTSKLVKSDPAFDKILGFNWDSENDTFRFSVKHATTTIYTKRMIASDIARLYVPLGICSPVLIKAKFILQELWCLKTGWDEPIPSELLDRWNFFRKQLLNLNTLTVPRWLKGIRSASSIQLHGFSDASQLAMAAVIYVRVCNNNGLISSQLVCSKTKVAPIKRLSIPRLKLTAALLLARLLKETLKALEIPEISTYCWTDSSVALTWINSPPSRWKEYVQNRVAAIHEILPETSWKFVPGKENPADCATRGISSDKFSQNNLWWMGTNWLIKPPEFWPTVPEKIHSTSNINFEIRPGNVMLTAAQPPSLWSLLNKYSSLRKLARIVAICRRFIRRIKKQTETSPLHYPIDPSEIQESIKLLIGYVQRKCFPNEIRMISQNEQLPRSNPLVRLTPFLDKDGFLRVGGRIQNAPVDTETKHPLILPKISPLTTLIIDDAHVKTLHGGTQLTLSYIRSKYWILSGRVPVRSHILRCIRCARYRGQRAQQLMGRLPVDRVTPSRPFLNTGLDYAGPFSLKTWRGRAARSYKGYLAIFVCLSTSAVHIEIVTDYTKEAFIAAFKRFSGRRGISATIRSDCGTNFIGADSELRHLFNSTSKELREIANLLANDGTKWIFNPPAAPHMGGKWEAAVKSTKFHLRRVLGDTLLTYEELNTIIIQIEAVLNSRPLCPLSEDVSDLSALTPAHFLIGQPLTVVPEPDLSTVPAARLTRWQLLRSKVDQFWKRWSSECLQRYQAISKWHHPTNTIKEGSLVLIIDERYPPGKWPLARVTKIHPGADGLTRVVSLKTASSSFTRPINKICILPVCSNENHSTSPLSKAGGKC